VSVIRTCLADYEEFSTDLGLGQHSVMRLFTEHLRPGEVFACTECSTHLARKSSLKSREFKGKTGPAFLFSNVVNLKRGPPEKRQLLTGDFTVQEVFCVKCESHVGWTYVWAKEATEQYKVGMFVLETSLIQEICLPRPDPFHRKSQTLGK